MRILRFSYKDGQKEPRFFVVQDTREVQNVVLRLLNEVRVEGRVPEGAERDFVEQVADEQDADTALSYLSRRYNITMITPEVV